jgi:hypothetical protein
MTNRVFLSSFGATVRSVFTKGEHITARTQQKLSHPSGPDSGSAIAATRTGPPQQKSSNIMSIYSHRQSLTHTGIRTAIGLGACAALLLLAVGTASADSYDGTYDVETPMGSLGEWTIKSCGPVCSEISLGGGGNKKADPDMATGAVTDGNVRVTNGQGSFTATPTSTCPDKTSVQQAQSYTVNLETMTGTVAVIPTPCAAHGGADDPPFTRTLTLTKI